MSLGNYFILSSKRKYNQSWINTNEFICKDSGKFEDVLKREATLDTLECVDENTCHGEDISNMIGAIRNNYNGHMKSRMLFNQAFEFANPHIMWCFIQTNTSSKYSNYLY